MQTQEVVRQKVLIYCRVSDTKQKTEGHGLDSQEHRCRQYASIHGYEVEKVFPDDASGGDDFMKRPGMVALLSHLDQHPETNYVVLFDDLKRFARDREFHFKLRQALNLRGASVECLNFRFEDTPEGEFIETIFAAQGQLERQQNRRQVVQKMKARLEAGYYVFAAPAGYKYQKMVEHGKLMVRDEPVASVIQEALEGYASGRFQIQAEVQRFLEQSLHYPYKDKKGRVHPSRVRQILTCVTYAGHLEKKDWKVPLRKGQHEGLITLQTFEKIQERLTETARVPARKDIHKDFPLRGFVLCDDCEKPLTSCWSKGKRQRFPYYLCYNKECDSRGKSIPRDKLEEEFVEFLSTLKPTKPIFDIVATMFKEAWKQQYDHSRMIAKAVKDKIRGVEQQIQQILDRLIETTTPSVIQRYEERITQLEKDKLLMEDSQENHPRQGRFEELFEHTMNFLQNPQKIWALGGIEHKRIVLKLAFANPITYSPKIGTSNTLISQYFQGFGRFLC